MRKELTRKKIDTLYHLYNFIESISNLSNNELKELVLSNDLVFIDSKVKERICKLLEIEYIHTTDSNLKEKSNKIIDNDKSSIDDFRIDNVMSKLRSLVIHSSNRLENASELDWLLRILIASPQIFPQVREVDNFLSNMTGIHHDTKSTGRDRIIDWYFKSLDNLSSDQKNEIYFRIAKYIFINLPSNYKEWKEILYK